MEDFNVPGLDLAALLGPKQDKIQEEPSTKGGGIFPIGGSERIPAAAVLALGAVGSVPPSLGVVEGGEIPYKPEALAKKKQNQEKRKHFLPKQLKKQL